MEPNLKMEVYNSNLELQGILETWDSLMIEEWAFEVGSFSLESVLNTQTRPLLIPDNILWIEGDTAGIIEYVQMKVSDSGYTLSIKGSLLVGILSRRILWGLYNQSGSPPKIMYDTVKDCSILPTRGDSISRIIPNLVLAGEPPEDPRTITKQSTGSVLTEFLKEIAQTHQVSYGVRFNPSIPQMEFWARLGVNRTIQQTLVDPVLYSTELDDVLSSEYFYDSGQYKNIALVAGEGEGINRKTQTVVEESGDSLLPSGYTPLEYIESTGEQFIDLGILVSKNTTLELDLQIMDTGSWSTLFGSQYSQNGIQWNFLVQYVNSTQVKAQYLEGQGLYLTSIPDLKKRNLMILGSRGYSFGERKGVLSPVINDLVSFNSLYVFAQNINGKAASFSKIRLYGVRGYEGDQVIHNFIPCKSSSGDLGVYDLLGEKFHSSSGTAPLISGPQTDDSQEPMGLFRREFFVDARDLQSDSDPDNPMTEEEYLSSLRTRGSEKLSDNQLVQSFSATVRTLDPTYEYGRDFFLGDTITVTDERLGVSVSAVVEGVERSFGKEGDDLVLTLGYSLPTISDRLRKVGV